MEKIGRLLRSYLLVTLGAGISYEIMSRVAAIHYQNATMYQRGELVIDQGNILRFLYWDMLIWYTCMALLAATIGILKKRETIPNDMPWRIIFTRKANVISGVLFVFFSLGIVLSKSSPDPVRDFNKYLCFSALLIISARFMVKEVTLRRERRSNKSL